MQMSNTLRKWLNNALNLYRPLENLVKKTFVVVLNVVNWDYELFLYFCEVKF